MFVEFNALVVNEICWTLVPKSEARMLLGINGFLKVKKKTPMVSLRDLKPDWWLKDFIKDLGLILRRHLAL